MIHLSKKRITKIIEDHINSGAKLTAKWLKSIHEEFTDHCIRRSESDNVSLAEVVYWELYGKPACPICGKLPKFRRSIQQGYSVYCSSICAGSDDKVKLKRISTNQEKYGVNSPTQVKSIRIKQSNTMLRRYGVKYGGQSKEFVAKAKETLLINYGVESPLKSSVLLDKARATWRNNYGVDHPMKNRAYFEAQQKKGFRVREVKIKGKTFRVRGFEPYVLHWLVTQGVKASDIATSARDGVPSIEYYDKASKKTRTYHPDMRITRKGKQYLIEVKSTYTAGLMRDKVGHRSGKFSNVVANAKACEEAGWAFKLIIVSKNKRNKECVMISNITSKSRAQVRKEYADKITNLCRSDL